MFVEGEKRVKDYPQDPRVALKGERGGVQVHLWVIVHFGSLGSKQSDG